MREFRHNDIWLLTVVLIVSALVGCSPKTVETVHTEYRDRDVEHLVTDTVIDMRVVWVKGDTVVDVREKEHIRRVEIHDTCYIEHVVKERVPYPVERKLSWWEQTKMDFGGFAMGGIAVALSIAVVWMIRKFRK